MSFNAFRFREAIGSIALSHEEDCDCLTCRAAGGDERAMGELMVAFHEVEEAKSA